MSRRIAGGEITSREVFYAGPMLEAGHLTYEGMKAYLPGFTVAIHPSRRLPTWPHPRW